ncbi:hypothetical protein DOTSEDRAFT_72572 [Lecanosticta acicola]|uniref:Uncharacterized protein n=1 Tax=Lecanosticta acicola TaxID=111012 RepID=A0AAI9EE49_9PEZI|nr:hypothetical protein DOTSEDRAFT_72572 [Lecanosticta acicola]
MADGTKGMTASVQGKRKDSPPSGGPEKMEDTTDSALSSIDYWGGRTVQKARGMLDSVFPPEKRTAFVSKLKDFILANPKVSAFLGINLALTGIPLGLFILFSLSVFIFALVVALVVGLLAAILFTLGAVGLALIVVFPIIMFTTVAACLLFLWGLGGYYILKWASSDKEGGPKQASERPRLATP